MRSSVIFFFILFSKISFGAPCSGALVNSHKNPDGSNGGMVAKTAFVAKTVTIDTTSSVCEKSVVQGNVKVMKGSEVAGSAVIEGGAFINASKIKDRAKIYGNAIVTNSSICQASLINFNVSNSTYYCDLEEENPRDPGEQGGKTLLGIDANVNGIRDDVEIWINNKTSNTQNIDLYNIRMSLRQIAKSLQGAIKFKDNKNRAQEHMLEWVSSIRCLKEVTSDEKKRELAQDLYLEIFNTEPRFFAYARAHATLDGLSLENTKKDNCGFKKR